MILAGCQAVGFTPRIAHRTDDYGAVAALVGAGLGVGLVPALAGVEETAVAAGAAVRALVPPVPSRHLFAACRRGAENGPAMRAVMQALVRHAARAPEAARAGDRRGRASPTA